MQIVSSTDFRKNLVKFMIQATENWEPIVVKSPKCTGVFISFDYWKSIQKKIAEKKNS